MSHFREFILDLNNATGDEFGRLRVSAPHIKFDSELLFDDAPGSWDDLEVSGAGTTSVHSIFRASSLLSVANLTAGRRVRQTYRYINHNEGLSQLSFVSGVLANGGSSPGNTRRFGMFGDGNGIYVEDDGVDIGLALRSTVTGAPVDTRVAQANWNTDVFDGSGPSEETIDWTKVQMLVIDFSWLGAVRLGFLINGRIAYAHTFQTTNNLTSVPFSRPSLPIRYEIINDGTGPAASLEQISSAVLGEGAPAPAPGSVYVSTADVPIPANATNLVYTIVAARIASGFAGLETQLQDIVVLSDSGDSLEWGIVLGPVFDVIPTFNPIPSVPGIEFAVGTNLTTIASGVFSTGGYLAGTTGGIAPPVSLGAQTPDVSQLGVDFNGDGIIVALVVRPLAPGASIYGGMILSVAS